VLLALRRWVWAPVWRTPLPDRNRRLPAVTMARPRPEISIRPPDPMIADPATRAVPAIHMAPRADLVAPADPVTRAAQADPRPLTRAD
jgi:hypothetical protein